MYMHFQFVVICIFEIVAQMNEPQVWLRAISSGASPCLAGEKTKRKKQKTKKQKKKERKRLGK